MQRDLAVIGLMALIAVCFGAFFFFSGPSSLASQVSQALNGEGDAVTVVPMTLLAQGTNAVSITVRTNYRIQNAHDLAALWELIYGYNDTPAAPPVDFSKDEVLAVFDGSDPTTGYSITITSVTDQNGQRLVLVSHGTPDTSCKVKNTPTSPFEVVEVPKTANTLSHQDQMGTAACE